MRRKILLDEFHVSVTAPAGRPERVYRAIRRTLTRPTFQLALLRGIRQVCAHYASLRAARITLSR